MRNRKFSRGVALGLCLSAVLAAGGYITPDEYKAKRKAVIDAM